MERVASGTIELSWDSGSRLATIRFEKATHATGKDAAILVEAMRNWIGVEQKPFGLLGDGKNLASLDAEYRAIWGAFFKEHRQNARIAFFGMGPVIRIAAEMFRIGTGLRLKACALEDEARAWMREMGIQA